MAKTKVAKTHSKRRAKASRNGSPKSAAPTKSKPRLFSDIEIGHVAGQVWVLLANEGSQSLTSIKKSIDAPDPLVMAAIGWLARENKLLFGTTGRSTRLTLR